MRTPFADPAQFEEKAGALSAALQIGADQARALLAHLAGYTDVTGVEYGNDDADRAAWSSREELIARLLASRPDMGSDAAANVIDRLGLRVRDADIDHVATSPDAVPNMGG